MFDNFFNRFGIKNEENEVIKKEENEEVKNPFFLSGVFEKLKKMRGTANYPNI